MFQNRTTNKIVKILLLFGKDDLALPFLEWVGLVGWSLPVICKLMIGILLLCISWYIVLGLKLFAGRTFEVFKSKLLLGKVGLVEFEMTYLLNMPETFILFYFLFLIPLDFHYAFHFHLYK